MSVEHLCWVKRAVTLPQMGVGVVPIELSASSWHRCTVRFSMRMPSQVLASVIEFRYAEVLLETPVQHLQIRTLVTCTLYTVCAMEILALPKRIPSVGVRVVVFDPGKL